jgi:aquaporin Z
MNKYLIEAIGTLFLVLVIGLTVSAGSAFAPLAIGGILMTMIYMGGHISGGHYNPAVSLAAWIRGALPCKDLIPYILAQIAGGLLGAVLAKFISGSSIEIAPGAGVSIARALTVEAVFTFALASVVLNTATSKDHPDNSFYGLAIGFTVVAAAFAGGGISGGAFNPAVGINHNVVHGSFGRIWLYLVGPLTGGMVAGLVFKLTNPHEYKA